MRRFTLLLALAAASLSLGGCDLVGDILEFGFWVIIIIVGLIVLLGWLGIRSLRSRGRRGPPRT